MSKLAFIFFVLVLAGCTESTTSSNNEYVSKIVDGFKKGQTFYDVTLNLNTITGKEQELWNLCEKKFESVPTNCSKGHSLIAIVSLPNRHWWLKEGTGQIYFTFDADLKLIANHYEIYYPRYHE